MGQSSTSFDPANHRLYDGWIRPHAHRRKAGLSRAECKKRDLSRRGQCRVLRKRNTRTLADYVGPLAAADHRRLVAHVQTACRKVLHTCWHADSVTQDQQRAIYQAAEARVQEAGLRYRPDQLAKLVTFWITAYDPAKALWFSLADLSLITQEIVRRFPLEQLDAVNVQHAGKLAGRKLDYLTLALICCGTAKNSLIANGRTRIEECGVAALIELLATAGISANGSLIRIARDILESIGLIKCIDRSYFTASTFYRSAGKCQRWTPAGATWDLPFLQQINRDELTDAQRAEFDAHQLAKELAEQAWLRDLNSMQAEHFLLFPSPSSFPSLHTLLSQCEAPSVPIQGHDDSLTGLLTALKGEIMTMF